jgi:hypothetical protein
MKKLLFLVLMLVILSNSVLAAKYEYKNPNFNAGRIKNVVYLCMVPKGCEQYIHDPYAVAKMDAFVAKDLQSNGLVPVPFSKVLADVNTNNNVNITELNTKDPKKAALLTQSEVAKYDALLVVKIVSFARGKEYAPAVHTTTTETIHGDIYDTLGTRVGSYSRPESVEQEMFPAEIINNATVMLDFKVSDPKTDAVFFVYNEDRSRKAGRMFNRDVDPAGIAGRITNVGINEFASKVKDDAKLIKSKLGKQIVVE